MRYERDQQLYHGQGAHHPLAYGNGHGPSPPHAGFAPPRVMAPPPDKSVHHSYMQDYYHRLRMEIDLPHQLFPQNMQGIRDSSFHVRKLFDTYSTPCHPGAFLAMDCEMVGVASQRGNVRVEESALARVTLVDWYGTVLMDEYVKPDRPVTNYRTFVSGVTKEHLENAMDWKTCRQRVLRHLYYGGPMGEQRGGRCRRQWYPRILVGHGLENDLAALRIHHPWFLLRDTAKYEPFMQQGTSYHPTKGAGRERREQDFALYPCKLKSLAAHYLNREIQQTGRPHCAYEDAMAALSLYQLTATQWEAKVDYDVAQVRYLDRGWSVAPW